MTLTKEQLIAAMPNVRANIADNPNFKGTDIDGIVGLINKYAPNFGLNGSPKRMAHFLAQVAHESAEMRYTEEIASGAQYEGRKDLGNVQKGDGVRFKGRGLIQLTGRANYAAYKKFCGYDVVAHPELLAQPVGAIRSAMWFWLNNKLNTLADADNLVAATKRVNGGTNGLESRRRYLAKAKAALGVK